MKVFFEEYGMVLVVTILAAGMIAFANDFKTEISTSMDKQWADLLTTPAQ